MNTYLGNAFSLQMVDGDAMLKVSTIDVSEVDLKELKSVVGHEDTAKILGVEYNRQSIKLNKGDTLVVAQLVSGRL